MTTVIKTLVFDKELVNSIKSNNLSKEFLYNKLNAGEITLREFLAATQERKA